MNKIYHTLLDKFVDESYSVNYIKTIIASTIKVSRYIYIYISINKCSYNV